VDEEDIQVERCKDGWSVSRGTTRLRRFANSDDAVLSACRWAWQHASEQGGVAWLKHGDRRTRINFAGVWREPPTT